MKDEQNVYVLSYVFHCVDLALTQANPRHENSTEF